MRNFKVILLLLLFMQSCIPFVETEEGVNQAPPATVAPPNNTGSPKAPDSSNSPSKDTNKTTGSDTSGDVNFTIRELDSSEAPRITSKELPSDTRVVYNGVEEEVEAILKKAKEEELADIIEAEKAKVRVELEEKHAKMLALERKTNVAINLKRSTYPVQFPKVVQSILDDIKVRELQKLNKAGHAALANKTFLNFYTIEYCPNKVLKFIDEKIIANTKYMGSRFGIDYGKANNPESSTKESVWYSGGTRKSTRKSSKSRRK